MQWDGKGTYFSPSHRVPSKTTEGDYVETQVVQTDVMDLGSSTKEWRNLYIDGTANIDVADIGTASIAYFSSSLIPGNDNVMDLRRRIIRNSINICCTIYI